MPNTGKIVVCPFYITHSESRKKWQSTVTCEKIQNNMGFEIRNMLRFYDKEEQEVWIDMFCTEQKRYMDCPYCKAIYKKYKDYQEGKNEDFSKEIESGTKKEPGTGKYNRWYGKSQ